MKKRNIKSLQLNKHSISNLKNMSLKGGISSNLECGNDSNMDNCDTDINSCYWLVCPFSDPIATNCTQEE